MLLLSSVCSLATQIAKHINCISTRSQWSKSLLLDPEQGVSHAMAAAWSSLHVFVYRGDVETKNKKIKNGENRENTSGTNV